tara:strand:- start:155 stop:1093 length:939 start_codon:yes stop_codon:yes gene_type:complete
MVGCGQIGNAHFKAIQACDAARVAFCVDVDPSRAEEAAAIYGGRFTTVMAEALASPEVDAAVLCLPHDLHLSFTTESLAAGKHVLVEKPMALNEDEARKMADVADKHGRNLMVGQSTRFLPSHQKAKRLIEDGRIGRPINYARQTCFWVERLSTDWRRDADACGGLYLPLFGSHDVDAMLWLLDTAPITVDARIRAGSDLSDGDVEGWIGLTFEDEAVGSIAFSLRSKETIQGSLIVGAEGTMRVERNRLSVDGEPVSFDHSKGALERQMEEFVSAIVDSRAPSVPGTDGVRTMRVLDLARASSEQQKSLTF